MGKKTKTRKSAKPTSEEQVSEVLDQAKGGDESDVKRPELTGHEKPKTKFPQPGTHNQKTTIIK